MTASPSKKIAVTGANGFIGAHCVFALLEAGFSVVAVVRDPSNETKTKFLKDEAEKLGKKDFLSFASGDLYKEGSYDDAFSGAFGVLHTAAVVDLDSPSDAANQIVKPAVDGTKNVLGSVKKNSSSVERFVNISSNAAVLSYDKPSGHVFVDDDWNTYSSLENGDAYGYAKTQAEKVVWDDEDLRSSVQTVISLNPVVVLGPAYTKSHAMYSSAGLITQVMSGQPSKLANAVVSFVDVRDVAKGAVLSFTQQTEKVGGKRFLLCATKGMTPMDLNDIVKTSHPEAKGMTRETSKWAFDAMLFIADKFAFTRESIGYQEFWKYISRIRNFDSTRSKTVLGIGEYRALEETCKDTADSILPFFTEETNE